MATPWANLVPPVIAAQSPVASRSLVAMRHFDSVQLTSVERPQVAMQLAPAVLWATVLLQWTGMYQTLATW